MAARHIALRSSGPLFRDKATQKKPRRRQRARHIDHLAEISSERNQDKRVVPKAMDDRDDVPGTGSAPAVGDQYVGLPTGGAIQLLRRLDRLQRIGGRQGCVGHVHGEGKINAVRRNRRAHRDAPDVGFDRLQTSGGIHSALRFYMDIRRYLKPYSMVASRTTTINHAFAASIAPSDNFDVESVRAAIIALGQNPDADLFCVYCGAEAETRDHVHATVKDKKFSGHGHRVGNLLPCCEPCNSKKGNKDWRAFLAGLRLPDAQRIERELCIDAYLKAYTVNDIVPEHLPEYRELQELRRQVLELFARADKLAGIVRSKSSAI